MAGFIDCLIFRKWEKFLADFWGGFKVHVLKIEAGDVVLTARFFKKK